MTEMNRYADQRATRAALEQADKHRARAAALEHTIREHYRQVHAGNWEPTTSSGLRSDWRPMSMSSVDVPSAETDAKDAP